MSSSLAVALGKHGITDARVPIENTIDKYSGKSPGVALCALALIDITGDEQLYMPIIENQLISAEEGKFYTHFHNQMSAIKALSQINTETSVELLQQTTNLISETSVKKKWQQRDLEELLRESTLALAQADQALSPASRDTIIMALNALPEDPYVRQGLTQIIDHAILVQTPELQQLIGDDIILRAKCIAHLRPILKRWLPNSSITSTP